MIKKENKIEKRNDLNELRARQMTMQQLRFFAIYLSRINARDESTRRVSFPLQDFQKIMGLTRMSTASVENIKAATRGLLCQVVTIPKENGGYSQFQLFKECEVDQNSAGAWTVTIDAHDKALPLFFDFKEKYFIYDVGNVLRLASANQIRMYEILKQRQNMVQPVTIQLAELRELLGVDPGAYPEYNDFKKWVIDKAKKELAAQTDITFTYSPIRAGRKVAALEFTISKNAANFPQMSIAEWIHAQPEESGGPSSLPEPENADSGQNQTQRAEAAPDPGEAAPVFMPEELELYAEALPEGMTAGEVDALQNLARKHIEGAANRFEADIMIFDYLQSKTKLMNAQHPEVKNRFAWLKKAIAEDWN
ncbi:MAG: RepB family plasmid replication initiator protein [Lachnospiraceae bacterium]|nr:RepB family plasmid replication initiator protein [Lachnospiraceae bacterium]